MHDDIKLKIYNKTINKLQGITNKLSAFMKLYQTYLIPLKLLTMP